MSNQGVARQLPFTVALNDGRRCLLRAMVEDDAKELCVVFPKTHAESDFLNWMPGEFDWSVEKEREFLRERLGSERAIGLVAQVDGWIIGLGGVWQTDFKRFAHHAELGLTVIREFWGQGIGRKIMEVLVDWGRGQGLRKIYLKVFHDNHRAIKLYESFSFIEEARLPGDVLRGDGSYGDTIIMARYYVQQRP